MNPSISHANETVVKAVGSDAFLDAVQNRRSFYSLKKSSIIPDAKIQEIVERAVKHAPNAFNAQQSRAVIVTGAKHDRLWDFIEATSNQENGNAAQNSARINGAFKPAYGTVLFFEDDAVLQEWIGKMPSLVHGLPVWSGHATGILQYIVWSALEAEGLGASLQHYSDVSTEILAGVNKMFDLPASWKNTAMLPFGDHAGPPGKPGHAKAFASVEDRVKVFFS